MSNRLALPALICAALLSGCGNENEKSPVGAVLMAQAKGMLAARAGKATKPAAMSRAEVEKYEMPLLRVKIAARGVDALVAIRETRDDITTWTTTDGTTFTFRDGVLIETRGLGSDLMSSSAPTPAQLANTEQGYARSYYVTGPNGATDRRHYDCTTVALGPEEIEVVERVHRVTHVQETCSRSQGKLTSDYWLEDGFVRKSRQWVSPLIGYAEFERVVD